MQCNRCGSPWVRRVSSLSSSRSRARSASRWIASSTRVPSPASRRWRATASRPSRISSRRATTRRPLTRSFLKVDPPKTPELRAIMERNSPGALARGAPVFLAQGTADEVVRPAITRAYMSTLCQGGARVKLHVMAGGGHMWAGRDSASAAVAWIGERFKDMRRRTIADDVPLSLSFAVEKRALALDAPAVARERAVAAHHAMTRDGDGHGISGAGRRHCPHGGRPANAPGELACSSRWCRAGSGAALPRRGAGRRCRARRAAGRGRRRAPRQAPRPWPPSARMPDRLRQGWRSGSDPRGRERGAPGHRRAGWPRCREPSPQPGWRPASIRRRRSAISAPAPPAR